MVGQKGLQAHQLTLEQDVSMSYRDLHAHILKLKLQTQVPQRGRFFCAETHMSKAAYSTVFKDDDQAYNAKKKPLSKLTSFSWCQVLRVFLGENCASSHGGLRLQ
eukprot:TRINITY_DN1103_c0_g1_i6.p2 TRINITY_DN1103_c0_g1~~TRINITY_DN1103_c0_g1_i6.p2  ORF type:complete len:105 (+),score=5.78 TRINITY_DN1103_c0_g1_i6:316-630(+)